MPHNFSHITNILAWEQICHEGLMPNKMGIVYLSPRLQGWRKLRPGEVLLKVTVRDQKLSALEDCSDWEVFCWGHIPPEDIGLSAQC